MDAPGRAAQARAEGHHAEALIRQFRTELYAAGGPDPATSMHAFLTPIG